MFLCNTLGDENTVMFLCSFLFFWFGLVPQSAAQSLTWPARQWIHSRSRMIPEMANYYLLLFSFFKSFEMLHLTFKKTKKQKKTKKTTKKTSLFFNNFNNDTKIHMEMGKMVCFDRNWQESIKNNRILNWVKCNFIG